jgi:hypothetical protein
VKVGATVVVDDALRVTEAVALSKGVAANGSTSYSAHLLIIIEVSIGMFIQH